MTEADLIAKREYFDELFGQIFSPDADYSRSALFHVINRHKPAVIVSQPDVVWRRQ